MKNVIRTVKVWLCYKGNPETKRYVLGTYHPNVKTIYLSEYQYWDILRKYGAKPGDVYPRDNIAKVKILWNKGISSVWS